jgi:hypothetical protein
MPNRRGDRRTLACASGLCGAFLLAACLAVSARAQNDAQLQQYVQLLQPVMWQELDFIRQVCDLTPEQRPKIRSAADMALKDGAKAVLQPQRGGRSQTTVGAQAVHDSLLGDLKKTLTTEQLERYEAEDAKRAEATKQAVILGVVAQFDGALFLSKEQREKMVAGLDKDWQRDWEQWLITFQYNGQYYPQVPDKYIAPLLNDEQKLVWSGLNKVSINSWNHNARGQNDEAWWNPQGVKTAKAATTNAKGKAALLKAPKKE